MTSAGNVLSETNMSHEPGQAVANFTISLPQSVNACWLHVRIRAGNSAGMSAPSEAVDVGELQFSEIKFRKVETNYAHCAIVCSGGNTDSTTAASTTTAVTTASSTRSGSEDNSPQGNSTTLIGKVLIL